MRLFKLVHPVYVFIRGVTTAVGLAGFLRSWLGPLAGRTISRIAVNKGQPIMVNGHPMILSTKSGYAPLAMAVNRYEEATTRVFQSLVKPGMVVIDVGAHVGYYSLLAARQVGPAGKVSAIEPESTNFALLQRNIELNGYTNIVMLNKAASNRVGSTTLFLTALDNGRHSTYRHASPERGSIAVDTTTLDAVIDAQGWAKVDLVKVDVEGAERDVLDGMDRLLQNSTDLKLIIEFSPALLQNAAADPLKFLQQLWAGNFDVRPIVDNSGPVAVPHNEWPTMIDKMLKSGSSVNIICSRGD